MQAVLPEVKGRADGKIVNQIVRNFYNILRKARWKSGFFCNWRDFM